MRTRGFRPLRGGSGLDRVRTLLRRAIDAIARPRVMLCPVVAGSRWARIDRLEPRMLLAGDIYISEFMAANVTGLTDQDGSHSDWIEVHNAGSSPANMLGWHLTDDATRPHKWTFPSVSIPADGYLVVFASNKDRAVAGQELHTNFNLDASGEYLALIGPDGSTKASEFSPYPSQEGDISYGLDPASNTWRFIATPTPGAANARSEVVINEIHYNPDVKTELVEFVELYNPGSVAVDLTGAAFTNGVQYSFPDGARLQPNGYLVVTQDPVQFKRKFGVDALGPYVGALGNDEDHLEIRNRGGGELDEVDYKLGFPWPTVGDAPGYSIELINPDFDNNLGGNWQTHAPVTAGNEITLFPSQGNWYYRKGTSEPSDPITDWRQVDFVQDSTWKQGKGPIGYGENFIPSASYLSDMSYRYSTFYVRKTFTIDDPSQISALRLEVQYDDGFNAWINGHYVAKSNSPGEDVPCTATSTGAARENYNYDVFNIAGPFSFLHAGTNVVTIQVMNQSLGGSSDAFVDARLIATLGGSGGNSPTPGQRNSVYATNAPPQMRQVSNVPQQPTADQSVIITAKITDPDGVNSVVLAYQLVDPGNYIEVTDPEYKTNWTSVPMRDDGLNGDAVAGDGVYTYVMPASLQTNRRLVRYKITSTDGQGLSVTAPYVDDPQPNFAYYVYNGIPAWSAAIQPGSTDPARSTPTTYSSSVLSSLPVYQLITKESSHDDSQYIPGATQGPYGGDAYPWSGTLIYDGVVYDNVHYRARGGVWRYAMGKNMWKFDFNRGHELAARDAYGNPFPYKFTKLNFGANIQQGDFQQRGEQGLFEYVGFKLFNLAGAPASLTTPVEFRIVENASETGATQYDTDFQGMYLLVEQDDGRFLDDHDLPDGNLYKMESGYGGGSLNNQGATQPVVNNSDLVAFTGSLGSASEQWLRANVNLESYYGYRSIVEAIHHWDIGFGKNYYFYHNPVDNKWTEIPWDLDLTWTTTYEPGGGDAEPLKGPVLNKPALLMEYRNRLREIRDLLFNPDQTGKLIDEYINLVDTPSNGPSMVDADRAMWDYNPIMASGYVNPSKSGQGRFYQAASTKDFRGMAQRMKDYIVSRDSYIDSSLLTNAEEAAAPRKSSLGYIGTGGYPIDQLQFSTSAFQPGNQGGAFAAMEWRIADVSPTPAGTEPYYEINPTWQSGELTTFNSTVTIPPTAAQAGHTYRVRVRMKDSNGRWGHWSDPVQFVASAGNTLVKDSLRITEMNYHPSSPPEGSAYINRDDYEFIELRNVGPQAISLKGVTFDKGINFTFGDMSLGTMDSVVLVRNLAAFQTRYSTLGVKIAGEYGADGDGGNLSNDGERLRLLDALGQTIFDFTYSDAWYPTTDGGGYTLVVASPSMPTSTLGNPNAWRASRFVDGTPGASESTVTDGQVVISEVLAHTDQPTGDWIEIQNTTDHPIDIGGWWLSDDTSNMQKWRIPARAPIPAYGFATFTATDHFGGSFALNELGDEVVLSSAMGAGVLTGYQVVQHFRASDKEVTLGRYTNSTGEVDFVPLSTATFGFPNAQPLVGPVVINEVMYNPPAGGDEYIELRNTSSQAISLYDPDHPENTWRLTGVGDFSFPAGASLGGGAFALVVGIDPAVFRAKYNIPASVQIFGPYATVLDNGGEDLELLRPGLAEAPDFVVPYYLADNVKYRQDTPWPAAANGGGAALSRIDAAAYGSDPANWRAENGGSAGKANFDTTPPTVIGFEKAADPAGSGVASIQITFSEPVSGLSWSDLVLSRNGGANLITAAQGVSSSDGGTTWTVDGLAGLTFIEGSYALTVKASASIKDISGNAMAEDGAYAFSVAETMLGGTSPAVFYVGLNGSNVEIYRDAYPAAAPTYIAPLSDIHSLTIQGDGGNDRLVLLGDLPFLPVLSGGGGQDSIEVRGGSHTFSVDLGSAAGGTALWARGNSVLTIASGQTLADLILDDTAVLRLTGGASKMISTAGLSIAAGAVLDLADNDLILTHGDADHGAGKVEQLRNWLRSALVGGGEANPWTGAGLTSNKARDNGNMDTAIAIFNNDDGEGNPWMENFNGIPVDQSAIILKYTYFGDSNADGVITADDFAAATAGWFDQIGGIGPTWMSGDYDYDGKVTADDFALVTGSWFSQDRSQPLAAAEPEAVGPAAEAAPTLQVAAEGRFAAAEAAATTGPTLAPAKREPSVLLVDDLAVLA